MLLVVVVSVRALVSIVSHKKMKTGYVVGFKRFVERIGSLQRTRESVATISCQVSEKCGSHWKSQLSEAIFF